MSGELWAIIGVVVGATIPGGIGLTQAILQRRWSVNDRESAWKQEKRDRLFEAKRSAHEAFADGLKKAEIAILAGIPQDDAGAARLTLMSELTHLHAQLQIYASLEAAEAAGDTISAVIELSKPIRPVADEQDAAKIAERWVRTLDLYIKVMRQDLGREDGDYSIDELMAALKQARG